MTAFQLCEVAQVRNQRRERSARFLAQLHEHALLLGHRAAVVAQQHPQVAAHHRHRRSELVHRQREELRATVVVLRHTGPRCVAGQPVDASTRLADGAGACGSPEGIRRSPRCSTLRVSTTDRGTMLIRRAADIRSSEITDERLYVRRREFLQACGLAAVGVAAGGIELDAQPRRPPAEALERGARAVRHDGGEDALRDDHHLQQLLRVRHRQGVAGPVGGHAEAAAVDGAGGRRVRAARPTTTSTIC